MEDSAKNPLSESEFYFRQGEAQQSAGNVDVAISCYEECVRIGHPYFTAASLLRLAAIYRSVGQPEKETETLKRIDKLPENEKKFLPHSIIGWALGRLGKYDEASEYYAESIKLKPTEFSTVLNFAELKIIIGRLDDAEILLKKVETLPDPKIVIMSRFFFVLIAALKGEGNYLTQALSNFIEAVKKVGVPGDLHWDFTEIAPTLSKIADENNSQIVAKLAALLERRVPVGDFLKDFSAVSI